MKNEPTIVILIFFVFLRGLFIYMENGKYTKRMPPLGVVCLRIGFHIMDI